MHCQLKQVDLKGGFLSKHLEQKIYSEHLMHLKLLTLTGLQNTKIVSRNMRALKIENKAYDKPVARLMVSSAVSVSFEIYREKALKAKNQFCPVQRTALDNSQSSLTSWTPTNITLRTLCQRCLFPKICITGGLGCTG